MLTVLGMTKKWILSFM